MKSIELLSKNLPEIENKIHYSFKDRSLLELAMIHRSYVNENRSYIHEHNERLEFLGDTVLGLIIAEHLYLSFPDTPEGELSTLRSRLVEAQSCVYYIEKLGIQDYLLMGKGEKLNEGRGRDSILADLFEAVIGAIFLDGGFQAAKEFLFGNLSKEIEAIIQNPQSNWKALLQDYSQRNYKAQPIYETLSEAGPDHLKTFEVSVSVEGKVVGTGVGTSKKEAQQEAAKQAVKHLNIET